MSAVADEKSRAPGQQKVIGLLGGIAWASSLEYYRLLNEDVSSRLGKAHSARCALWSLDLQEYLDALKAGDYHKVRQIISGACARLANSGVDFIVLCSNTAHIAADSIQRQIQQPLLHMADCTALAVKKRGFTKCGFLGTKFAMENPEIQLDRLRMHGLEVVVPSDPVVREKVWSIIELELSVNKFTAASKQYYKTVVEEMVRSQGVSCVILGCTEIPLVLSQSDTAVPLIDTTRIHAKVAVDVSLGLEQLEKLLPPCLQVEKPVEKKKKKPSAPLPLAVGGGPDSKK